MQRATALTRASRSAIVARSAPLKRGYAVAPPPVGTTGPPPASPPPPPPSGGSNTLLYVAVGVAALGGGYYYVSQDPKAQAKINKGVSEVKTEAKKLEGDAKNLFETGKGEAKGAYYDAKSSGQSAVGDAKSGGLEDKAKSYLSSAQAEAERAKGNIVGEAKEIKEKAKGFFK